MTLELLLALVPLSTISANNICSLLADFMFAADVEGEEDSMSVNGWKQ
jgi:hypothetical protein